MNTYYLLYDQDCALCRAYTNLFIRGGFLNADSRIPYQEAALRPDFDFDTQKAKTRIALVSSEGERPYYGLESLLHVLGFRWPWLERIGRFAPVYWLFNLLYLFISYNRKVISPASCQGACDCAPPLRPFWRWSFMILCWWIVNAIMYSFFNAHLSAEMKPVGAFTDFWYFAFQAVIQIGCFAAFKQRDLTTYLGHLSVVSLIAALLVLAGSTTLQLIADLGYHIDILFPIFYGAILVFMFYEHKRRLKVLGYTQWLSVSWIISRLLLYCIAFNY